MANDILKEAIADAKAVRETALANAKMALEEAFTPQLKSMLSAKLREDEFEDEDDVEMDDELGDEEEVPAEEANYYEDEEEVPGEEELGDEGGDMDGVDINIDADGGDEEEMGDEEDMEEEGLELEDIIRELEAELSEDGEDIDAPVVDETIEVNGVRYTPIKESDIEEGASDNPSGEADPDGPDNPAGEGREVNEETEEYEIDESLFKEEEEEEEEEVEESNTSELESELKEYKEAVVFLKDKLHEVNILNAKLLFTNKLFKQYSLDNNQKLKVVETFDRAQTTREIKLVYSTLAEQFSDNGSIVTRKSISESASSAVSSTKPSKESRKVISEETQVANRFKKLAGLI